MAFVEFYMQNGGDDRNAGTDSNTAAAVTSTNGAWDSTTNIFTAASGSPFNSGHVGQYASIQLDASTNPSRIAKILSQTGSTVTLSAVASERYGTSSPGTAGSGMSLRIGGAWASLLAPAGMSTSTVGVATRLNVKSGIATNGSTSRNFSWSGTAVFPLVVRGCTSNPGDLDYDYISTLPTFLWSTAGLTHNSSYVHWQNIRFEAARAAAMISSSGNQQVFENCEFENKDSGASSYALSAAASSARLVNCWLKTPGTVNRVLTFSSGTWVEHCLIEGGAVGAFCGSTPFINDTIFRNCATAAIRLNSASGLLIANNTVIGGTSGILFDSAPSTTSTLYIYQNLFHGCTNGINNPLGTGIGIVTRYGNSYYNVANREVGFGDSPAWNEIIEPSDPLVNGSTDPTLKTGALSRGFSSRYRGQALFSYRDIGGIQHQDSGGFSGSRLVGPSALVTPGGLL